MSSDLKLTNQGLTRLDFGDLIHAQFARIVDCMCSSLHIHTSDQTNKKYTSILSNKRIYNCSQCQAACMASITVPKMQSD